jgi:hypothetical protein
MDVCMYECMDGWMYGMDGWMYGWMDVWMYGCMYVRTYVHTYVYKERKEPSDINFFQLLLEKNQGTAHNLRKMIHINVYI